MNDLKEFNAQNWPINTQVAFEPWVTIDCVKILTYMMSRKGEPVYSTRGMAAILSSTQKTISRALTLLIKGGYITKIGGCYFINSTIEVDKNDSTESKMTHQRVKNDSESESKMTHNNNKEIIIKNKPSISDNSPEAPLHLRRYKNEPLKQHSPHVWLTDSSVDSLLEKMKNEQELDYWISELDNSLSKNPKAATDHYLTILRWRRREIGKGMKWEFSEEAKEWIYVKVWK